MQQPDTFFALASFCTPYKHYRITCLPQAIWLSCSQSAGIILNSLFQMNVCQKCGDRGEVKRLIYCNKCHVSAEHSYCLDTLPRKGEKEVLWACEECCSIDANPSPVSSRKSERIQGAARIKLNRMKLRKQARFSPFTAKAYTDNSSQVNQPVSDYFGLKEAIETQSTSQCLQNEELKKPRRRMVVKDDNSSDEESDFIEGLVVNPVQPAPAISADSLNVSHSSLSSESDRNIHAKPTIDPIWKGSFNIQNWENHTSVLLLAHLSTNACSKVRDAARALPVQLNIEILSRSDAWPQKFQTIPPTVESIGLYFFPRRERDEKVFDSLLDEMIIHDHALKVVINDLELLVFSSCELPQEHWRFCQKYFLWGVFKATKKHAVGSNAEASMPFNLSNNAGTQGGESLG
ncbi:hypothetical protein DKX38_011703 [Salix brachista]|uniref:AIPP2-like SPOC-like domain-containing protein n=1 Tax=Salix brachista TaxID=2182728 RepID=A0A5N5LZQ9_9ROSI|nr:hypothetical protein DKX38_011703 [Salix brachista]